MNQLVFQMIYVSHMIISFSLSIHMVILRILRNIISFYEKAELFQQSITLVKFLSQLENYLTIIVQEYKV